MRYLFAKHHFFGFILILLIAAIHPVVAQLPGELLSKEAQSQSWVDDVPCGDKQDKAKLGANERLGYVGDRQFRLCFDFAADKLQPTSDGKTNYSELYITSYTKQGEPNLTELKITRLQPDDHVGLRIDEKAIRPEAPQESLRLGSKRVFKVSVEVIKPSHSARHPIAVAMTSGKETGEHQVRFDLPIFVPNSNSVPVEPKNNSLVDCWAGSACSPLELEVQNKLPYKVSITNISIESGELLESQPTNNYLIDIEPNSNDQAPPRDWRLDLKAKSISFSRVLRGLGLPQITFRIDFRDEYGRTFFTKSQANLEIKPNILMIGLFLVVGAGIGTYFRRDPGKLQRLKLTTPKQRWCFIASTFVTGIVVCLLAVFLNIKIVVLENDNSLSAWDPKMLLATAFVATCGGLPLIYAYFNIPQPQDPPASNPPQTTAPGNNNS